MRMGSSRSKFDILGKVLLLSLTIPLAAFMAFAQAEITAGCG